MRLQSELDATGGPLNGSLDGPTLAIQRSRWMQQKSTAPNLPCAKEVMFPLVLELLRRISDGEAADLNACPKLASVQTSTTWKRYSNALGPMGLTQNRRGVLRLTREGAEILADGSRLHLASLMADRIRVFAETLGILVREPRTISEVNSELVSAYPLDWSTEANTRLRITWLEVLGLVEWLGERKLGATPEGRKALATWKVVAPEALTLQEASGGTEETSLPDPPAEISSLIERLVTDPSAQGERNTYNIWVPSPSSDPNKIDNMRTAISAATEPIEKDDLLEFIAERFGLKRSSVDSMMPFMRAAGLLQEVRRGVFVATPAAKAWLQSEADIDFIRILHAKMRFIGELIDSARISVRRSDLYREGAKFGVNDEKVRWRILFLLDAGLLVETSTSSVQATRTGLLLVKNLPLADRHLLAELPARGEAAENNPDSGEALQSNESLSKGVGGQVADIVDSLIRTSVDPNADGEPSGAAFEKSIESVFRRMGFEAQRISGSGDTDVLVRWYHDGVLRTAIVDGKSTTSGRVVHTNVSDIAISAHKEKHSADFVAIVGPSFSGETIRNIAQKKKWALISAVELGDVVTSAERLGLRPAEIGVMFEVPDGVSKLVDSIEKRQRELDLVSLVVSRLKAEVETGEALSPRDIALIERGSSLAPSVDELLDVFGLFVRLGWDVVEMIEEAREEKFSTYRIGDAQPAVRRLRALANAIEVSL